MIGERTTEGLEIRLKPRGAGRFFGAGFLGFWLCGWAAGEAFALWILIRGAHALLTGGPIDPGKAPLQLAPALAVGIFLLVWLTIWTVGGIAAFGAFFSAVWAEDRIIARGGGVTLRWSRGPFRGTREFARDRLRSVGAGGRGDPLYLETDRERLELSRLGTVEERRRAVESLRSELTLAAPTLDGSILPKGWEEIITPEGERALAPDRALRRTRARVALGVTAALSAVFVAVLNKALWEPGLIPAVAITGLITALLAWGTVWLTFGRVEYRIGSGSITARRRFRSRIEDLLEIRRLEMTVRSDSDADNWFTLDGTSSELPTPAASALRRPAFPKNRRTIASTVHDSTAPRLLGAWMARAANVPFTDRTTREVQQADLEILTRQLEQTGRLGRWTARLVRKAQEKS